MINVNMDMTGFDTYIFDFDYTLADSSRGIVMCFRHVMDMHGHKGATDWNIKRTIGKTLEESFSILTGITCPETLEQYRQEYTAHAALCMNANTHLFEETAMVLNALKDRGAGIGILSTKYRYRIVDFTDTALGKNFFDVIIGGEDVTQAKPAPEGLLLAMDRLHCDKDKCLYVGDSTIDALTAQAADVAFAGVTHGMTTREELERYDNVMIMDNLKQLL